MSLISEGVIEMIYMPPRNPLFDCWMVSHVSIIHVLTSVTHVICNTHVNNFFKQYLYLILLNYHVATEQIEESFFASLIILLLSSVLALFYCARDKKNPKKMVSLQSKLCLFFIRKIK